MDWQVRFGETDDGSKSTTFEIMINASDFLQPVFSYLFPDEILEKFKAQQLLRLDSKVGDDVQTWDGIWRKRIPDISQEGLIGKRPFQFFWFRV